MLRNSTLFKDFIIEFSACSNFTKLPVNSNLKSPPLKLHVKAPNSSLTGEKLVATYLALSSHKNQSRKLDTFDLFIYIPRFLPGENILDQPSLLSL